MALENSNRRIRLINHPLEKLLSFLLKLNTYQGKPLKWFETFTFSLTHGLSRGSATEKTISYNRFNGFLIIKQLSSQLELYLNIYLLLGIFLFFNNLVLPQTSDDSIKTYTLKEAVVTGTRSITDKNKIPASISVLKRNEIEKNPGLNILSQLNGQIPGLFIDERNVSGFGVGPVSSGTISIRGIGGNPNSQVLVLIDGQPQFMGLFGHPIHDSYLSSDIERIEVIRGPGSLLYGSNAAGGIINIITRKLSNENFTLRSLVSYGSFNTTNLNGFAGYKNGGLNIITSFNRSQTDGHRKDGDNSFRTISGFSKLSFVAGDHFTINADGNISDSKFYDPGTETNPNKNNYYNYLRGRAATSINDFFGMFEGALKFYYNFGEHDFFDGWHSDDNIKGITFYQNIRFYQNNVFTIGIDYKNYGGKGSNNNLPPIAAKGLNKDYSIDETDAYGILQYYLTDEFTLNGGLRLTNNSHYGTEKIPQFGFTFAFEQNTIIKGNISKAFRSPTIADLFFFPVSNEELKPERFWNYEISLLKIVPGIPLKGELTLFYIEGDNLIQVVPPGQKINTGNFIHKGVETSFAFLPFKSLRINLNYTYLNTKTKTPYAPEHQLNSLLEYGFKNIRVSADLRNIFNLYPFGGSEKQNYTTLALLFNIHLTEYLQFFIKGENITDAKYYIDEGYPSPGISFQTGIKAGL